MNIFCELDRYMISLYRLNWIDDTPEKEDVTAEGISEYLSLIYRAKSSGDLVHRTWPVFPMHITCHL